MAEHLGWCGAHYQRNARGADMNAPFRIRGQYTHGIYSTYANGYCKCRECLDAWNRWRVEKRASKRPEPFIATGVEHGHYKTYVKKGCRCNECKAANAKLERDRRMIRKNPLLDQYRARVVKCEICGKHKPLVVDHDHATGAFRGLLCSSCNTSLGKFGDSIEILNLAIAYLSREQRGLV